MRNRATCIVIAVLLVISGIFLIRLTFLEEDQILKITELCVAVTQLVLALKTIDLSRIDQQDNEVDENYNEK
jgi:hypothetical protein